MSGNVLDRATIQIKYSDTSGTFVVTTNETAEEIQEYIEKLLKGKKKQDTELNPNRELQR